MKSKSVLCGLLFSLVFLLPLTSKDADAAISLSVNPASVPADSLTGFTFQTQANTAGGGVQFEVYFDFNGNGIVDGDEWPFFDEVIVDNVISEGNMLFGDNDPVSPNITVDLSFDDGIFLSGSFIVRVENEIGESATVQFTITSISSPQTVTGTVYEQGTTTPVANALVYSADATTDAFISATTTDDNGFYTLQIPAPGDIYIGHSKEGYIESDEGSPLTVPSSGISDFNLYLIPADAQITGTVTEYGTSNPVWGVEIDADTTDGKESDTTTDISGNFTLPVLANKEWGIWIEDNLPPGYFGAAIPSNNYQDNISLIPTVLGPNVIDAVVHKETAWIESTVMDEYGTQVVEGASLYASRINTTDPELQNLRNGKPNITGSLGQATVGVEAGDWSVGSCIGCEGFPVLVGGEQREIIRPSEQDVLNLLTGEHRQVILYAYYADCAVEGTVFHEDGVMPAVDVAIDSWTNNALNGPGQESVGAIYGNWGARSDATGHYRLPIMGGTWNVRASGSDMQSIWKQATCLPDGNDIVDQPGETIANVDLILIESQEFFVDSGQSLGSSNSHSVSLGDLDNDGDLDAFVVNAGEPNKVWLNDGTGIFTDSGQSLGSSYSLGVAIADIDKDGDLDAFVVNANGHSNKVWLNNGAGIFTDSGQSSGNGINTDVALGDIDGDGDPDAVIMGGFEVLLNNGTGIFTSSDWYLDVRATSVALGDVDNDGDLDAFLGCDDPYSNGCPNKVLLNNGAGIFMDSGQSLGNSRGQDASLGDLDNDGDLDAFVANVGFQPSKVWLNNGAGIFTDSGQSLGGSDSNSWGVTLGDLDGDGDLDAFISNGGFPNKVWINDGAGTFTDSGQSLGNSSSYDASLGDLDGDGDLDAFVANGGGQPNKVWLNNTDSIIFPHSVYDINQNWTIGNFELLTAIDDWANGLLENFDLLDLIDYWAFGSYCWDTTASSHKAVTPDATGACI